MTVSATEVATLCTVPTLALEPYAALALLQVLHEGCSGNNATITLLNGKIINGMFSAMVI